MLLFMAQQHNGTLACRQPLVLTLTSVLCFCLALPLLQVVYNLADWVKVPMQEKKLVLPLHPAGGGLLRQMSKAASSAAGTVSGMMQDNAMQGASPLSREVC